jgi:hypothetical protein
MLSSLHKKRELLGFTTIGGGVVQAVFKGGVFGLAYSTTSSLLIPLAQEGKIPKQLTLTLAGGIGSGPFSGLFFSNSLAQNARHD